MPDTTTPTGRPAIGFNSTRVQWMGVGSSPHKPDAALAVNDLERTRQDYAATIGRIQPPGGHARCPKSCLPRLHYGARVPSTSVSQRVATLCWPLLVRASKAKARAPHGRGRCSGFYLSRLHSGARVPVRVRFSAGRYVLIAAPGAVWLGPDCGVRGAGVGAPPVAWR